MKIKEDFKVYNDLIEVRNFSKNSTVPFIPIRGMFCEYVKDYFVLRNVLGDQSPTSLFFYKIWNQKSLHYDPDIDSIPKDNHTLLLYILKYISIKGLNLEKPILLTHLKSNMVLHSLYNTRGSCLHEIIEILAILILLKQPLKDTALKLTKSVMMAFVTIFSIKARLTTQASVQKK